ncbi:MAG: hypothetical protein ABSG64_05765 [Solirubrobacteraceae bacterium]|jgi:hypothetical protein
MNVNATGATAGASYPQPQPQPPAPPAPPALTNTAALLGLSTSQLRADMRSGTTLSSLASQAGVSSSRLVSAIESDLQAGASQAAPPLSLGAQVAAIATRIASGRAGAGDGGAPPSDGALAAAAETDSSTTQSNLSKVASSLGTDPGTLLAGLTGGEDLRSAFAAPGATGYGSSIAQSVGGGVLFDEYA